MLTLKATARVVGALFILASATAIIGGSLLLPIEEFGYLTDTAAAEGQMAVGALLEVVLAFSVIGIAVLLYPVLKREDEGLALGYVAARIVEGVLILAATLSALMVLTLSQDYGALGTSDDAALEPLGSVLQSAREWTYLLGTMLVFALGALILYTLLYRSKLVPTWLSVWGLIGGALLLVRAVFEVFGVDLAPVFQALLTAPIGINEMVLAVWLILRGFDESALSSDVSAQPQRQDEPSPHSV